MGDWFRKSTWTPEDATAFDQRLARARPFSRPQYLRVQAVHLLETGNPSLIRVAADLALRSATEYPSHPDASTANCVCGQCLIALGDTPGALERFRLAVEAEDRFRAAQTDAYLHFCWAVARRRIEPEYQTALELLARFKTRPVFPVQRYRYYGALALILGDQGDRNAAQQSAQTALVAAGETRSPFRSHPTAGLVKHHDDDVHPRLQALVD